MIWRLHGDGGPRPGEVVAPGEKLGWSRTIGLGAQHVVALFSAFVARTHDVRVWIAPSVFAWLGVATFSLICWAMTIDVINDTEVRFGDRRDGTVYATCSWRASSVRPARRA